MQSATKWTLESFPSFSFQALTTNCEIGLLVILSQIKACRWNVYQDTHDVVHGNNVDVFNTLGSKFIVLRKVSWDLGRARSYNCSGIVSVIGWKKTKLIREMRDGRWERQTSESSGNTKNDVLSGGGESNSVVIRVLPERLGRGGDSAANGNHDD